MSGGQERRRQRIVAQLAGADLPGTATKRLCEVCAEVTEMTGAGIMLMAPDGPRGSLCTTDAVSELIEQLQYDLGEGPCIDAHHNQHPILEPDLAQPARPRWVAFSAPALASGVRAVFGFPLQVGAVRLGALNLYRDRSGPLSDDQHANALAMADVAARSVLLLQAEAAPGALGAELESGADFQYVVHQAAGMVSVQLDLSIGQALVRMRAHAFGNDRPVPEVARDVVARVLRFDASWADDEDTAP